MKTSTLTRYFIFPSFSRKALSNEAKMKVLCSGVVSGSLKTNWSFIFVYSVQKAHAENKNQIFIFV